MKSTKMLGILALAFSLLVWTTEASKAAPMGTAFTYQGRLIDANAPADGLYDFQFNAYEKPNSTKPLACLQDLNDIDIIDGYFTVELDFGDKIYDVNSVWIEISVRPGELVDPNAYVILSPRQQITPAPLAVYASSATISPPLHLSDERYEPVIKGTNSGAGAGVQGETSSGGIGGLVGRHTETGNYGYVGSTLYGVYGEINTDAKEQAAVYGKDNVSGNYGSMGSKDYGVYGLASGRLGKGVYGCASDTTEYFNFGGYFEAASQYGHGVYGLASGSHGYGVYGYASDSGDHSNYGGCFRADSNSGYGVYGLATGGAGYGVYGIAIGREGCGVYGEISNLEDYIHYAGHFVAKGKYGRGVFGEAQGSNGYGVCGYASDSGDYTNYGGYFLASGKYGRGVYGHTSGSNGLGVYGNADGVDGCGVYGSAINPGDCTNYGGYFKAEGKNGYGVYGRAYGSDSYAVYGWTSGSNGYGIYGYASDFGDYTNYGGYFLAAGKYGRGVVGEASGSDGRGVYGYAPGSNSKAVVGSGGAYDFYASGPGEDYGSASSIRWKRNIQEIDNPLDKILQLRGVYFDWDVEHGGEHDVGMIAEEVGQVLPEIVQYEEDGKYATGMDYSKMTPLLVEAVKELKGENDRLKERVEALEKTIQQLVKAKEVQL